MKGTRVVVVGASVAGLMSALAFARGGAEVELLDRDPMAVRPPHPGATDTAIEAGWRKGVPQARHTHACAALGRRVLRERAPDVWAALLDAGAVEMPFGGRLEAAAAVPRGNDTELFGLSARRSLVEDVLRRIVLAEPNVQVREPITATGLLVRPGAIPVVEGVRTSAGDIRADLTIDALGRASPFGRWLDALGARAPEETAESCGLVYLTRWYRIRHRPAVPLNAGLSAGGYGASSGCIACPADNGYVSITMMTPHGDTALYPLAEETAFTAAARLHAGIAAWLEPGVCEPLSTVLRWPHCENRFRRFVVDGEPIALGWIGVGDSVCVTNPTYTRGMSLAARHAFAVADLVAREGLGDRHRLALGVDALAQRTLRPWFDDSIAQDRARNALWSGEPHPQTPQNGLTLQQIAAAARHDDVVWHALARRSGMLDEPDAIFAHADVLARVRSVLAQHPAYPPTGPSRDDLMQVIDAHCDVQSQPALF
ncbi:NAD(P)/FAD-dependent oxidoreductase [Ralstonia solanacearum]|uniref:NAD(P)/FAD-dependent oxidoreductase n=1 Tax=Ralstonia solanacearum TaxID=305 RepID=UPI0035188EB8